jgi:hypothetical protein
VTTRSASADVQSWTLEAPAVSAETILRLQKYRNLARVPRAIRTTAEAVALEAMRLMAPQAVVWRGPVTTIDRSRGEVTLGAGHRFHSATLARALASARHAYALVLTIGPDVEQRVSALLTEHQLLEGMLLDTAAWAAITTLVREMRRRFIARERSSGCSVTHRLAPGLQDWPVAEQPSLLAIFGDGPLPVRITEADWVLPRKSVSGVFGVVGSG